MAEKSNKKGSVKEMLFLLCLLPTLVAPSLTMAFEAGYSKGFYIKEGKEYSLKARIRGQVQGFLKSEEVNGEREEKEQGLYFLEMSFLNFLSMNFRLPLREKKPRLETL